ncbi:MAG: CotH kinase family protein [Ignavibacteriales bacterium]|nr:CotH kinase family protein [Ignavibacteriales bacterium]
MAANTQTIADPDYHEYADWIELYNSGMVSVNLKNFSITDNLSQPRKYQFVTDIIIAPGAFLLIWADDKNTGTHANFKLSASGEKIGLFNAAGQVVDTLTFGAQQDDISCGRFPDAAPLYYFFKPATPGSANLENGIYNRLADPVNSFKGGFYTSPVLVTISHPVPDVTIRYTLNGETPSSNSSLYTAPIRIDSTTVLKARAFKAGILASKTITNTYFITENTRLPVFSLSTDPGNFFSDTAGIYVIGTRGITGLCSTSPRNWNQEWERPVAIEFFERDRNKGFSASAGVKIYGGCSRIYAMKSLAFYFRDDYGYGKLDYRLFPWLPLEEYNNFVLRSSGQDWWRTMFRDGMVQTLISQGTNLAVQAYRPSVVFLNGSYWGIYNIREKLNEHYLESHYQVDKDNVDIIEISKAVSANNGDTIAYSQMMNYVATHDLSQPENYNYIKSILDIDDYIDYSTVEIYAANGDWPGANSKLWRERTSTGKWRWMVYDLDFTFGGNAQGMYNTNSLANATAISGPNWPNPPWATLLLRKLLENTEFKNNFIQRMAAHANTTFRKEFVHHVIDSLSAVIAPEIARHKARWPQSISMGSDWNVNVQLMKDFATTRSAALSGFYITKFGLDGLYKINISRSNPARGKIFISTVEIKQDSLDHTFFKNVPLSVKAVAQNGSRFVKWEGLSTSTAPEIILSGHTPGTLTAVFEAANGVEENGTLKKDFNVFQNYPNPFNPVTKIGFVLPVKADVQFSVYSYLGELISTQLLSGLTEGYHEHEFNGSHLASGIYLYEIRTDKLRAVKKCILMK